MAMLPGLSAALPLPAAAQSSTAQSSTSRGWDYRFKSRDAHFEFSLASKKNIGLTSWQVRWKVKNWTNTPTRLRTLRVSYSCPNQGAVTQTHYFDSKPIAGQEERNHSPDTVCKFGRPENAQILRVNIDVPKVPKRPDVTIARDVTAPCDTVPGATRKGPNPTYTMEFMHGNANSLRVTLKDKSSLKLNLGHYMMKDVREFPAPGSPPPQVLDRARVEAQILRFACAAPYTPNMDARMMGAAREASLMFYKALEKVLCRGANQPDFCAPIPEPARGGSGRRG